MSIIVSSARDVAVNPSVTMRPRTWAYNADEMAAFSLIALSESNRLPKAKVTKPLSACAAEVVDRIEMLWTSLIPDYSEVLSSYKFIATLPDHVRYQCYLYEAELFLAGLLNAESSLIKDSCEVTKLILKGLNLFLLNPGFDVKDKLVACEFAYMICHVGDAAVKAAEYVHIALPLSKVDIIVERMWQARKRVLTLEEDEELREDKVRYCLQKQLVECVTCLFLLDYQLANIMIMNQLLTALDHMSLSEKTRSLSLLKTELMPKDKIMNLRFLRIQISVLIHNRFLPEAVDLIKIFCEKAQYPKILIPGIHKMCESFITKWADSGDLKKMQEALASCPDEHVTLFLCLHLYLVKAEELLIEERIDEAIDLFLAVFEWECPEKWFQSAALRQIEQYPSYLAGHDLNAPFVMYAAKKASIRLCAALIPYVGEALQFSCIHLYERVAQAYYREARFEEAINLITQEIDVIEAMTERCSSMVLGSIDICDQRSALEKAHTDFQKAFLLKLAFIVDGAYYTMLIETISLYEAHPALASFEGIAKQQLLAYQALAQFYTDPHNEDSQDILKSILSTADTSMRFRILQALIMFFKCIEDDASYEHYKKEVLSMTFCEEDGPILPKLQLGLKTF